MIDILAAHWYWSPVLAMALTMYAVPINGSASLAVATMTRIVPAILIFAGSTVVMVDIMLGMSHPYVVTIAGGVAVTNALAAFLLLNLNAKYAVQLLFHVMLVFGFIGGVGMILQLFTGT